MSEELDVGMESVSSAIMLGLSESEGVKLPEIKEIKRSKQNEVRVDFANGNTAFISITLL